MRRPLAANIVKSCGSYLILAVCLLASGVATATPQPLDAIQAAAEEFVRAHLPEAGPKHYVNASRLDPRLRPNVCEAPLETFAQNEAPTGARMTVGVRCSAATSWTLYVPVSVEVEVPVLVLRRALARRARVAPTDVDLQVRRLPGSAAHFVSDIASLQGHRLKRSLAAGTAITVDVLAPDILGRRGQQVTLIAVGSSVGLRAPG
jgi:flagella basal body P-ring formation protein FlgA